MRISDYEKLNALTSDVNILLDSEDTGTRTMFAEHFAKELVKFLGTNDLLGQIDLSKLVKTTTASSDATILFEDGEHKYATGFGDLPYIMAENHIFNEEMPQRKNLFRGKNLGSVLTETQLKAINDGTFNDLFLGDYWEINNIRWRIVDMDYWYRIDGKIGTPRHHLVIMPDKALSPNDDGSGFANTSITGGYVGSPLRTVITRDIKAKVLESFSENIVYGHGGTIMCTAITNNIPTGYGMISSTIEAPSLVSIVGYNSVMPYTNYSEWANGLYDSDCKQFALFKIAPQYITSADYDSDGNYKKIYSSYYVRDMANGRNVALTYGFIPEGRPCTGDNKYLIRPVFALQAPAT